MDDLDKALLNRVQSDFPVTHRPYRTIAKELGIAEADVIERLRKLKRAGIVRRIGANFSPEKLGFVSTLCAAEVPIEKIDVFAAVVNRYPGVTHNYLRDNRYNVWFTFIETSMAKISKNLEEISTQTGVSRIINLPATRRYKIKAHFDL